MRRGLHDCVFCPSRSRRDVTRQETGRVSPRFCDFLNPMNGAWILALLAGVAGELTRACALAFSPESSFGGRASMRSDAPAHESIAANRRGFGATGPLRRR
jgi:hypothetical protein